METPRKKKEKHPKDMTSKEAMEYLFTPEGHKIIKRHIAEVGKKSGTKKD
jgi:hypothetical protein